jgi:hypothetical protein
LAGLITRCEVVLKPVCDARAVPSRGIHRHQPGDGQPGGGAVLQQAGDGRAVDQGR